MDKFLSKSLITLSTFCLLWTGDGPVFQRPALQSNFDPPSAFLDFRCPRYAVPSDTPLSLMGEVVAPKGTFKPDPAKPISYHWTVIGGSIIDGQGTSRVNIRPGKIVNNVIHSLRITLEPNNTPPEVDIRRTCEIRLDPTCQTKKIGEYARISRSEEEKQLDQLAEVIKTNKDTYIYLVVYDDKESCVWEAEERLRVAKTYLVNKHHIDSNHIFTVNGGFRSEFTLTVFTSTNSDCGPLPTPTVLPSELRISGRCKQK